MSSNELRSALNILHKVTANKISLTPLLQNAHPLTKEICFGFCRNYWRLETIADSLMAKRPKKALIWLIILIGLYQLYWLKKPDHAVVQQTVDLVDKKNFSWASKLINAILREFCRRKNEIILTLEKNNHKYIYNHPEWLINRLKIDWPNDWHTILKNNDKHPPMSLRINQQQYNRDEYLQKLLANNINASPHLDSPVGLTLDKACPVEKLPGFSAGAVSLQDEASQLVLPLLNLQDNCSILDACCAPGGKLCHILENFSPLHCLAIDNDLGRLELVKNNLKRLKLKANLTIKCANLLTPTAWWDNKLFDRILLDAPCSATGVIRRHSDIKLLRNEQEVSTVVNIQKNLLMSLWPLLAPQGILVYTTCSILKEENERQIINFLKNINNAKIITPRWGRNTGHGGQILPGENNRDGFFYSILQKTDNPTYNS